MNSFADTVIGDDNLRSIRIVGPYKVDIFKDENFGEPRDDISKSKEDISGYSFGEFVSSAEVTSQLASGIVSNLTVNSGSSYEISSCNVGTKYYIDRNYEITGYSRDDIAEKHAGLTCIKTANEDANNTDRGLIAFDLNEKAVIHLYMDTRVSDWPKWIDEEFEPNKDTDDEVNTSDNDTHFEIHSCESKPGRVVLPGPEYALNSADKNRANSMYVVAIEKGGDAEHHCGVDPPGRPSLESPANGQQFKEGQSVLLKWNRNKSEGTEVFGEVRGGPSDSTTFGWQEEEEKIITGLQAGYTYSWQVMEKDLAGQSDWSGTRTFSIHPKAPTALEADAATCGAVDLRWVDNSDQEHGYAIYRDNLLIAHVGEGGTFFRDETVEEATYTYTVRAVANDIESTPSDPVEITASACEDLPAAANDSKASAEFFDLSFTEGENFGLFLARTSATVDADDNHGCGTPTASVWYRFTPPIDAMYNIHVVPAPTIALLSSTKRA